MICLPGLRYILSLTLYIYTYSEDFYVHRRYESKVFPFVNIYYWNIYFGFIHLTYKANLNGLPEGCKFSDVPSLNGTVFNLIHTSSQKINTTRKNCTPSIKRGALIIVKYFWYIYPKSWTDIFQRQSVLVLSSSCLVVTVVDKIVAMSKCFSGFVQWFNYLCFFPQYYRSCLFSFKFEIKHTVPVL